MTRANRTRKRKCPRSLGLLVAVIKKSDVPPITTARYRQDTRSKSNAVRFIMTPPNGSALSCRPLTESRRLPTHAARMLPPPETGAGRSAPTPCWAARTLARSNIIEERKNSSDTNADGKNPICSKAGRPVEGNVNRLTPLRTSKECIRELEEAELQKRGGRDDCESSLHDPTRGACEPRYRNEKGDEETPYQTGRTSKPLCRGWISPRERNRHNEDCCCNSLKIHLALPNGHGAQLRAAREPRWHTRRAAGESTPGPAARRLEGLAGRAAAARQLQRLVRPRPPRRGQG